MPETPLPGAETWALYPELGIIILIMAVLIGGIFILWKQFTGWSEKQDGKREAERERARAWQASQDEKRDTGYQSLIREMQDRHEADSAADRVKLSELAGVIRQLVEQVTGLNQTLSEHIIEDSARFDVLLSEGQKTEVVRQSRKPR